MLEIIIINNKTNETTFIFGHNITDAFNRAKLIRAEWTILYCNYID